MQKSRWMIDVSLIVIIIVMGVFVYLELDRMVEFINRDSSTPIAENAADPDEPAELTPTEVPAISTSEQQTAPDFELVNLDGETVSLSDYRGKSVLVNFWATWCPPCRDEMPLLQTFADEYDQQLVVLAVNAGEEEAQVRDFVEAHGLSMVFLLDPTNSAATLYQVRGFPTSLFIDQDGFLQATHIGELDETLMIRYLEEIGVNQ